MPWLHAFRGPMIAATSHARTGRMDLSRDQPCRALESKISPRPLKENDHAISEPDQPEDVNHQPDEPRQKPGKMQPAKIGYGGFAPDGRHVAEIGVVKRLVGKALTCSPDV